VVDPPRSIVGPLSGWGRHPTQEVRQYRPERVDEITSILRQDECESYVSRGNGRSYGDAALNAGQGVILHERLDRFLGFDEETAILECESAVSFAEIIDVLLPRGFFLPVTPGTKHISVGGAIAADVHGKNHHRDGTISTQLVDFRLLTGTGEILRCSREENAALFWATVGGMGLTGAILDARLRLRRVETAYVETTTLRCPNLDATLEHTLSGDRDYAYAVAWIDCLAGGASLGRSVLLRANPAPLDALPPGARSTPLAISASSSLGVPFDLPGFAVNAFNMRVFNSGYYLAHPDGRAVQNYEQYFYPLDAVKNWNRVYGRRGVLQYQVVLPRETSRSALVEILGRTTSAAEGAFLAVLKSTGPANEGLLSFPIEGMSLALDFPNRGERVFALLAELDRIVLDNGGRVYLAKDSCMARETFQAMYPNLDRFREIKAKYDPEQLFSSSLARRLGIVASS
jgi:FAD/FMN-containing dehydrogenase